MAYDNPPQRSLRLAEAESRAKFLKRAAEETLQSPEDETKREELKKALGDITWDDLTELGLEVTGPPWNPAMPRLEVPEALTNELRLLLRRTRMSDEQSHAIFINTCLLHAIVHPSIPKTVILGPQLGGSYTEEGGFYQQVRLTGVMDSSVRHRPLAGRSYMRVDPLLLHNVLVVGEVKTKNVRTGMAQGIGYAYVVQKARITQVLLGFGTSTVIGEVLITSIIKKPPKQGVVYAFVTTGQEWMFFRMSETGQILGSSMKHVDWVGLMEDEEGRFGETVSDVYSWLVYIIHAASLLSPTTSKDTLALPP